MPGCVEQEKKSSANSSDKMAHDKRCQQIPKEQDLVTSLGVASNSVSLRITMFAFCCFAFPLDLVQMSTLLRTLLHCLPPSSPSLAVPS